MSSPQASQHQPNPTAIFETFHAYQRSYALKAAVELNLFTAIAEGHNTAAALAQECKASERGVRILCDFLTISHLLTKEGDRYSLTPDTAFFLDSRSPAYLGKAATFLLHPLQMQNAEHLATAIRNGYPAAHSCIEPEDAIWVDFAQGMAPLMFPAAQTIAQTLQDSLTKIDQPKILDIAAGHGIFGIVLAKQHPTARIVALDWPNVLEVAKQNAQAHGVADRHETIAGSAFDMDCGTDYDVVLLTNFLHHFDVETNESLLKKVYGALKPGGEVVILEFVPNDDRVTPPATAAFSLTMLYNTPKGDAYTFAELSQMCQKAGFTQMRHVPMPMGPESLVIAQRPR